MLIKNNKAAMYITDDDFVTIGGVPTEFQLIDESNYFR